uniref:UTP--glucose-1-phosphate uridylyltransferase n=1 Tax=Acrobeloides nanus TaxID=290746 RepID=A0A914DKJ5_9BILA
MKAHLEKLISDEKSKHDLDVFLRLYEQFLTEPPTIDWSKFKKIDPKYEMDYENLPNVEEHAIKDVLKRVVVVKLNGGLGTTMGCKGAKSLITVKNGKNFLDFSLLQVQMKRPSECFIVKEIYADSLMPVPGKADEKNDEGWYPPGHGNIFQSLAYSGILDELLEQGRDICFVSNIDNTGANVDLRIANAMCNGVADYIMEVTDKTPADVKGGTLIEINGKIMHLEMPQVPEDHVEDFCSMTTFRIFNTNNIWVNLRAVKEKLNSISMEIIANKKRRFKSIPSMKDVVHLTVSGDVVFGKNVVLKGVVVIIADEGHSIEITQGSFIENKICTGRLRFTDH